MKWVSVQNTEGEKFPEWMRSAGIDQNSQVFVPAGMVGDEDEVMLCALYDSVEFHIYLNHSFVPADWMAKTFPDTDALCKKIVKKLRERSEIAVINLAPS